MSEQGEHVSLSFRFVERTLERKPMKRRVFYHSCVMTSCDLLATQLISCLAQHGDLAEPIAGHAWCGGARPRAQSVMNGSITCSRKNFAHIVDHMIDTKRTDNTDSAAAIVLDFSDAVPASASIEDTGHPCHAVTL